MGQRVFKSEPEFEQSDPREEVLGREFVDWLRTNFGWLFGSARAKNGLGKAFVHADGPLPSWALLGEYDDSGVAATRSVEYIWLPTAGNAVLVGLFKDGAFYAVHPDHLGTPRLVTNADSKVIWQWPYSAFGHNRPVGVLRTSSVGNRTSVEGTSPDIELNVRFPGQYFDQESGLSHNHARSYQPAQGRYVQADPMGVASGLNRFGYVGANPISRIDPWGLADLNLLPMSDNIHEFANAWNPSGVFSVGAHGNPSIVQNQLSMPLTPTQLAGLIKNHPSFNGQPVMLGSCNTGRSGPGDSAPFAQGLADVLGVPVIAPLDFAWFGPSGLLGASDLSGPPAAGNFGPWQAFAPSAN